MSDDVVTSPDPTKNVLDTVYAAVQRLDDLRTADREWVIAQIDAVRREGDMRAAAEEKIRGAESSRIDAIRAVDVGNVSVAAERQSAAAGVLATQVTASAEALRTQFVTATGQLSDRITLLERSSYEGQGKSTVADPQLANLVAEMRALRSGSDEGRGRTGVSTPLLIILASGASGLAVFLIEKLSGH